MTTRRHAAGAHAMPGTSLQLSWQRRDHHRLTTALALAGTGIAVALAVFGLPPVDLHGPLHRLEIMGPLSGGTRAARYTAQGEWALAWQYNPLGIVAVLGAAAMTARTVVGLFARRWLTVSLTWTPRRRRTVIAVLLILLLALAVRQQLHADLLMTGT